MTDHLYDVRPGDWILTEEDEVLLFDRYSSTPHWGFFTTADQRCDSWPHIETPGHVFKLPLAGLRLTAESLHRRVG